MARTSCSRRRRRPSLAGPFSRGRTALSWPRGPGPALPRSARAGVRRANGEEAGGRGTGGAGGAGRAGASSSRPSAGKLLTPSLQMRTLIPRDLNSEPPEVAQPGSPVRTSASLRLQEVRRLFPALPGRARIGTRAEWTLDVSARRTHLASRPGTAPPLMGTTFQCLSDSQPPHMQSGTEMGPPSDLGNKFLAQCLPQIRFPYMGLPKFLSHTLTEREV